MKIKVYGPPGTGKTTYLQNRLAELLDSGKYKYNDIAYMSFTNSAIVEFLERLGLPIENSRSRAVPFFRTMHGIAEKLLFRNGIAKDKLRKTHRYGNPIIWYYVFCRKYGVPVSPDVTDAVQLGDRAWLIYSYAINKYYPKYGDRSLDKVVSDFPEEAPFVLDIIDKWQHFKEVNGILDFVDFLTLVYDCELSLPTQVLFADEFQDFSCLQYEIFRIWEQDKDIVMIAGDDDQAIMTFQGASPEFMLKWDADEEVVLSKSFRLARAVHRFGMKVISMVENRRHKVFEPRDEEGAVFRYDNVMLESIAELARRLAQKGYSVEVLFRTNEQVEKFSQELIKRGIKFEHLKRSSFWQELDDLLLFLQALVHGRRPKYEQLKAYLDYCNIPKDQKEKILNAYLNNTLPQDFFTRIRKNAVALLDRKKLVDRFGEAVEHVLYNIVVLKREYEDLKGKIIVDTIHAAKGTEADYVILHDSFPNAVRSALNTGRADISDEIRVWYVGVTRARKVLVIVSTGKDTFLGNVVGVYP